MRCFTSVLILIFLQRTEKPESWLFRKLCGSPFEDAYKTACFAVITLSTAIGGLHEQPPDSDST